MNQEKHNSTDVLVIGAGPAGTVAASILKDRGYDVTILERGHFPRFVIGESLLPRCMEGFEKAGFISAIEEAGFQKKYGARFDDNGQVSDFNFSEQYSEGWSWTWQVQRGPFDKVLADTVERKGVQIEYGTSVVGAQFDENGGMVEAKREDGTTYFFKAQFVVDASGYGRVLPRLLGLEKPSTFPSRAALFCHVRPPVLPQGKEREQIIIVMIQPGIWGWIIPFHDGTYSIGVVGDDIHVSEVDEGAEQQMRHWMERVPAFSSRFTGSNILFDPQRMVGYSKSVSQLYGHRFVLTGNSSEFIDPIFSSGVTFAVESSARAAELIDQTLSGKIADWENDYAVYLQKGVDVFKTFVSAWYDGTLQKIFFSNRPNEVIRKQICSILAGYVWDESNPYVRKHKRAISALSAVLDL